MNPRYKVGMRTVKTTVAIGICLLTFQLIGLNSSLVGLNNDINGIQAALAATICMKSSLQNTVKTGLDRTVGTVIGSVTGILFLMLSGSIPVYLIVLLAVFGVISIIYLCNILKLQASVPISLVVFLIILIDQHEVSPVVYGLARLAETVFGIFVAYLVNRFLDMKYFRKLKQPDAARLALPEIAGIRPFTDADIGPVMQIWLSVNTAAHSFINESVWHQNYDAVRSALKSAQVLVYDDGRVRGYLSVADDTITGLYVASDAQHSGIGTHLLDLSKTQHTCLSISVYKENDSAVKFLLNRGFVIAADKPDPASGHDELLMEWSAKNKAPHPCPAHTQSANAE